MIAGDSVSASCTVGQLLSVSAGNGWPYNGLRHHWLMPISCHFRDCKRCWSRVLTHISGAIASVQTFTFTFRKSNRWKMSSQAWYWLKIANFASVRGSPSEYCYNIWCWKTRTVGLLDGEKSLRICYSFRHNTRTWRTDRRTDNARQQGPRLQSD